MKHLILASGSPRRRELLKMIAPDFEVATGIEVDETYPADMDPDEVPCYLSKLKAQAYRHLLKSNDDVLVTADTVVILGDSILGKPRSREEAVEMLTSLAGRTHHVVTGVALTTADRQLSFSQSTEVDFDDVALSDIEYYVDNYRPYDKAGAYGIQEWIGAAAISGIRGSYYNVMGLPIHAVFTNLRKI